MANYSVESMCTSEIERAKDEHANWKIISLCSEAVMVGKVCGSIECPDLGGCSIEKLEKTIADAEIFGYKTKEASSWLYACKLLGTLRSLLVVHDFAALEHEISSVDKSMIPESVLEEVELIIDISLNEVILKKLKHSLSVGSIRGDVGNIRIENIQYIDLEAAIDWVDELGTKTRIASALLSLAKGVLLARKALKTGHLEDLKVRTARYENFLDDKFESSNWRSI